LSFCSDRIIDTVNVPAKFEVRIALPILEIIVVEVLGGVANPQSWRRGGRIGVGDGTVQKSVGEFLYSPPGHSNFSSIFTRF